MGTRRDFGRQADTKYPCVLVEAEDVRFALYPPTLFKLDEDGIDYKLVLPFGSAAIDVGLGNAASRRLRTRPGGHVLAEPGTKLSARYVEPLEFLLITMKPDRARRVAEAAAGRRWRLRDLLPWHDAAAAALSYEMRRVLLGEGLPSAAYLSAQADALITRVVVGLSSESRKAPRDALAPSKLARVLRHIDSALAGPITSRELASLVGLSPAHFARAFTRETGDPPHRFLVKRRICRARDLLSTGEGSIAEVAMHTGFSSQAHLSTAFLKEVGVSPAKYRLAFQKTSADGQFASVT